MGRKTHNVYDICKKEGVEIESEDIKKILEMTIIYENRFNLVYASGIVPKTVVEIESAEYFDEDREWEIVNKLSSKLKTPQVQKALENHGYDLSMGIEMDNWYFNSPGIDRVVINYKELEEEREKVVGSGEYEGESIELSNVDPDYDQEEVNIITGIGMSEQYKVDYDKVNLSELLVMDIRERKFISSMEKEKPSKKESKKNQIDLDL